MPKAAARVSRGGMTDHASRARRLLARGLYPRDDGCASVVVDRVGRRQREPVHRTGETADDLCTNGCGLSDDRYGRSASSSTSPVMVSQSPVLDSRDRICCYQQISYCRFTNLSARVIVIRALWKGSTHGLARCTVCATQAVWEAIYAMFLRMSAVPSTSWRPVPRQLIEVVLTVPFRLGPRSFSVYRFTNRVRFQFDLKGRQ